MSNEINEFKNEVQERIESYAEDKELQKLSKDWLQQSMQKKYVYNFSWMGRPIIQYPQDILALQEIIWQVKPDLIIETGIAHGGSIIFSASMLEMLGGEGEVLAIDIDIREHNRVEIEKHPMFKRITMLEGSSVDESIANQVYEFAKSKKNILVCLDSSHTHEHVLQELNLYSKLVTVDSYLVVFDTFVEDMPKGFFENRPWDVGNSPKTAVKEFLEKNNEFQIDDQIENKLLITVAPSGFLKRIK